MLRAAGDKTLGAVVGWVGDNVIRVLARREKIEADLAVATIITIGAEDRAAGFFQHLGHGAVEGDSKCLAGANRTLMGQRRYQSYPPLGGTTLGQQVTDHSGADPTAEVSGGVRWPARQFSLGPEHRADHKINAALRSLLLSLLGNSGHSQTGDDNAVYGVAVSAKTNGSGTMCRGDLPLLAVMAGSKAQGRNARDACKEITFVL